METKTIEAKKISNRKLHNYVLGLVGLWLLFAASFPIAYMRVSSSGKYGGTPFKSLTRSESQRAK